jgi:hypothetical protein
VQLGHRTGADRLAHQHRRWSGSTNAGQITSFSRSVTSPCRSSTRVPVPFALELAAQEVPEKSQRGVARPVRPLGAHHSGLTVLHVGSAPGWPAWEEGRRWWPTMKGSAPQAGRATC